jgi:hypothetical protein
VCWHARNRSGQHPARPAYPTLQLLRGIRAAIGTYHAALEKDPHQEPLAPRRKLTRKEWNTLLAVAESNERAYFLRALVAKRITLTD